MKGQVELTAEVLVARARAASVIEKKYMIVIFSYFVSAGVE